MKNSIVITITLFIALLSARNLAAQDVLLLTEDFETGGASFVLNTAGPGSNSGTNQWIVNNEFNGAPDYANTTTQNITNGGTIAFAPTSNYLHIHDQPSGITNANYHPSNASDRFAEMFDGVCTLGMDNVHLTFFYLCEGSASAYGTIYYSIDNGAWVQFGLPQYSNTDIWQYSDITDPAFSNVSSLRFGFRWQNDAGSPPPSQSFSIDDIIMVADYSVVDPVTINVTAISPSIVCQGGFLSIQFELSDPLCDGNYQIELSNSQGNFPSPFNSWVTTINNPQTTGSVFIQLPNGAVPGDCYHIRVNRLSPPPEITGVISACFEIIECPNIITTNQPVVTLDTNAVCVNSAIDVPFFSTGIYAGSNDYVCQISDPDGTFPANPIVVGSSDDNNTYDPALGSPPGSVGGLVPEVPPGCNYYLRIVSTNPVAIGSVWGPFCVQQCDISTNNFQDLSFCVSSCAVDPDGENTVMDIDVNAYNNDAQYGAGNLFTTQLLSSMTFAQIGQNGILGEIAATDDCQLPIHVPCEDSLGNYGLSLGMNYMRVVATESSTPENALGTLIHFTIGAYAADPQVITSYEYPSWLPKSVFCVGETAILSFTPYNYSDNSTYLWDCNGINNGNPFVSPSGANSNTLYVNLGGSGTLTFSVQETNYGCVSPWTPPITITVLGDPNANIIGPNEVCEGELVTYYTNYYDNTYYDWVIDTPAENIAYQDTSNNELSIIFSEPGEYDFSVNVLNLCGSDSDVDDVEVLDAPEVTAVGDTLVCVGTTVPISTPSGAGYSYEWTEGNTVVGVGNSIEVTPEDSTWYLITVTGPEECVGTDTVFVDVLFPDPPALVVDSICPGGLNDIQLLADTSGTYLWSNQSTEAFIVVTEPGEFSLVTTNVDQLCPHFTEYTVLPDEPDPAFLFTDSICPGGVATLVVAADSIGESYIWNTGDIDDFIEIDDIGVYTVTIYNDDQSCPRIEEFTIFPLNPQPINYYIDSICPGGVTSLTLTVDSIGDGYIWSTGETTASIEVTDVGIYTVNILSGDATCPRTEEYTYMPLTPPPPIYYTDSICPLGIDEIILESDTNGIAYLWNTGEIEHQIFITETGEYVLYIYLEGAPCPRTNIFDVIPDTCILPPSVLLFVPNAFTPDISDEINDVFLPQFSDPTLVHDYELRIYDRWGVMVWETEDIFMPWTGNFRGGEYFVQDGIYVWKIEYMQEGSLDVYKANGHLTIVR